MRSGASPSVRTSPRSKTDHRNLAADLCGFCPVVGEAGLVALGEPVEAGVLVGIGDLGGAESLVAQLALGMRDEVVVPLRVLVASVVGRDDDHVGPVVKVGDLRLADLPALAPVDFSVADGTLNIPN